MFLLKSVVVVWLGDLAHIEYFFVQHSALFALPGLLSLRLVIALTIKCYREKLSELHALPPKIG